MGSARSAKKILKGIAIISEVVFRDKVANYLLCIPPGSIKEGIIKDITKLEIEGGV